MKYKILKRVLFIVILVFISITEYTQNAYAGEYIYIKNVLFQKTYKKDDGSYAKNEWIYEDKGPYNSNWKYFNKYGNVVKHCYFCVNGKMYYSDDMGELETNKWLGGYYADETGALRDSPNGRYIAPFFRKKIESHVIGFPRRFIREFNENYQLLTECSIDEEDGRKAFYKYEYDSDGNLEKFTAMDDNQTIRFTITYVYDNKKIIKREYKDAQGVLKLYEIIQYNDKGKKDGDEWLRGDGSSLLKYPFGSISDISMIYAGAVTGSKDDARKEFYNFIAETCPENSLVHFEQSIRCPVE